MPYSIDRSDHVIYVRHFGRIAESELESLRDDVRRAALESGIKNTLIDARYAATFPSREYFLPLISRASDNKLGGKVAVLVTDRYRFDAEFVSLAASKFGISIRAFSDPLEAVEWLSPGEALSTLCPP